MAGGPQKSIPDLLDFFFCYRGSIDKLHGSWRIYLHLASNYSVMILTMSTNTIRKNNPHTSQRTKSAKRNSSDWKLEIVFGTLVVKNHKWTWRCSRIIWQKSFKTQNESSQAIKLPISCTMYTRCVDFVAIMLNYWN